MLVATHAATAAASEACLKRTDSEVQEFSRHAARAAVTLASEEIKQRAQGCGVPEVLALPD